MKTLLLALILSLPIYAQTPHTTASQEGNNTFSGSNTFTGTTTFSNSVSLGSNSLTAAAGTFTSVTATTGSVTTLTANDVQPANGSTSIATAYAALPSTGGKIVLSSDITISSSQTLTPTLRKPVTIDLNGRTLIFSHASGVGLTISASNINNRDNITVQNGAVTCSAAGNNTTAIEVSATTNVTFKNVNFTGCNGTGQTALLFDDVEDWQLTSVGFLSNTTGFVMQDFSNNGKCNACWFDANSLGWKVLDTSGVIFDGALTQSNTGPNGGQVLATGQNITNFGYVNGWLENNGDGTANARHIFIQGSGGHGVQKVTLSGTTVNGLNGAATEAIELDGTNTVVSVVAFNNTTSALGSIPLFGGTSYTGGTRTTQIGDQDANTHYNVGLSTVAGKEGVTLFPPGAARCFDIWAGYPSNSDGTLIFQAGSSCSSLSNILFYSSGLGGWELPTQSGFSTPLAFAEGLAPGTSAGLDICYGDATAHAQKCSYNNGSYFAQTQTIASGTATMTTALIAAGACGTTVTVAATGVATTDAIIAADNAAVGANPGVLIINKWPTANNVNFNYCNPTAAGVTPSAATLNWRVTR